MPTVTLSATGRPAIVPTARMYKRSAAGAYTLIASSTGPRIRLGATPTTVALPAAAASVVLVGDG